MAKTLGPRFRGDERLMRWLAGYEAFATVFQFAARFSAPRCDTAKMV